MTGRPRKLRRAAKWIALAATVVVVLVEVESQWFCGEVSTPSGFSAGIWKGQLWLLREEPPTPRWEWMFRPSAEFGDKELGFGWWFVVSRGVVALPIWPLGVWTAASSAVRFWRERWAVNRNMCPDCGYRLTGLAAGTKCPECGGELAQ